MIIWMDIRCEIKYLISKKGKTLKDVCENISQNTGNLKFTSNNISTKFSRKTIRYEELELILSEIGYHIEFVEDNK
ncbi:MAG: hypothetical protein ACI37T_00080 [Candidatus Gastranaerophilaceae bacterium]